MNARIGRDAGFSDASRHVSVGVDALFFDFEILRLNLFTFARIFQIFLLLLGQFLRLFERRLIFL